jgi:hypothetical protein
MTMTGSDSLVVLTSCRDEGIDHDDMRGLGACSECREAFGVRRIPALLEPASVAESQSAGH